MVRPPFWTPCSIHVVHWAHRTFSAGGLQGSPCPGLPAPRCGCPALRCPIRVSLAFPSRFLWGVRCPPGQSFETAGWIHQLFVSAPWRARSVWRGWAFAKPGELPEAKAFLTFAKPCDFLDLQGPAEPKAFASVKGFADEKSHGPREFDDLITSFTKPNPENLTAKSVQRLNMTL